MTKKKLSAAKKAVAAIQARQRASEDHKSQNFLPDAQPGCHIGHRWSPWLLGTERVRMSQCPDILVDPETKMLSVYNGGSAPKSFYISFEYTLVDARGKSLRRGTYRSDNGDERSCTTLVLVVPSQHIMDVGFLEIPDGMDVEELVIASDIKDVSKHESPDAFDDKDVYMFPLSGERFLCTQGFNGQFTHYFPGTYHAIDLACDVGTPVVAIAAGVVREVSDSNTASGIHAGNLYKWNSLMLELDNGSFVEYVHIKAGSVIVKPGDRVAEGQVICESGDVGFCPTPHLHIQVHHTPEPDAPTVMFAFRDNKGGQYIPEAGKWYNGDGQVDPPSP